MERTYTLDARLGNICCEKLKYLAYFEVAEVLNEFARQDAAYDEQEKIEAEKALEQFKAKHLSNQNESK